jgi:drug/metabolite transporter (DMT)-like permease
MTKARWLGIGLIVAGLGILLIAPQAQSCVTAFDHTSCRATGTILLKVIGLGLVATAAAVLALHGTPSGGSGDSTR